MPAQGLASRLVGAAAIALAGILALGGAAADPDGAWVGWAGWPVAIVIAAAAAALAVPFRLWAPALPAASGLLPPLLLLLAGAPLAGVQALSGPPLAALALAGLALSSVAGARAVGEAAAPQGRFRRVRLRAVLFPVLAFVALLAAAGRSHLQVGPRGDEPHYLMVAESILRDHDLALDRDYAEARYAAFHDAPLAPHFRVRGKGGVIYSLHAVGLSVLVLPAWALAGYAGVTVFMALLATLVACEVRAWVEELTANERLADAVGGLAVVSAPLVYYAGLVFTEVPAALALSLGLRLARRESFGAAQALAVGCAAAAMSWLNVRYAPLAAVVVAHALWRHPRGRPILAVLGPCALSAAALVAYHQVLYGFYDPRRVYGRRPELALGTLVEGLPGLLLDQEFGLLVYAPVLALAVPGFVALLRRDRGLAAAALAAVASVVLTAGTWHMWRGGENPPGRFLVPIAPLLLVAAALAWERRGLTAGASLLLGWTLWAGLAGAMEPRLVHRDRDFTAPLFRELSGAREWTALLPAYVLGDPDRHRLAVLWAAALALAVPWRPRAVTAARVGVASLAFVAASEGAAAASRQRTGDRDAVRLVGEPGLRVPGWRPSRSIVARWDLGSLGWGPLYEPHRHPAGAEIGRRLALPAGRYALRIAGDSLHGAPPELEVAPDRPAAPVRRSPLRPATSAWEATFTVRAGESAVNLRLAGGGPLVVRELLLTVQPPAEGPV